MFFFRGASFGFVGFLFSLELILVFFILHSRGVHSFSSSSFKESSHRESFLLLRESFLFCCLSLFSNRRASDFLNRRPKEEREAFDLF